MEQKPIPGYLVKVEDHDGDPLARFFRARISDPVLALETVLAAVDEAIGHLERNLSESEVEGMELGSIALYSG